VKSFEVFWAGYLEAEKDVDKEWAKIKLIKPVALRWRQLERYIVDKIIAANAQNTKKLTPCLLCSLLIAGSAIIK
jgi:hypothetical protein